MNETNKRPRIACLSTRDPHDKRSWSGLIYYIAHALQKHCGEVTYFGPVSPHRVVGEIGKMIYMSSSFLLKRKFYSAFMLAKSNAKLYERWLEGQSFDLIIAPDGVMEIAFLQTDIPILLVGDSTHSSLFEYYPDFSGLMQRSIYELKTVQELALKKAGAVIYSSTWAARSAIEDYETDLHKIHVVPFGANLDESPSREITLARKPSGHCRLLFLGVDWHRKGGDIAFETLLQLEKLNISAELIVCGCTPPKTFSHNRMKVIPFLNKNDASQRKELEKLFLKADFMLLPTRSECYGLVFCEANAFGLPIIATNTGGVSEVVKDGDNGFLLPSSARGIAYAELIAGVYRDEERYIDLVRSSRAAFENRLNWDTWGITAQKIATELLDQENSKKDSLSIHEYYARPTQEKETNER